MKNNSPHSGFSLIEVLVMTAITSILIAGLMNLHIDAGKAEKSVEFRYALSYLNNEIYDQLSTQIICRASFRGRFFDFDPNESKSHYDDIPGIGLSLPGNNTANYFQVFDPTKIPNCINCETKGITYKDGSIKINKISIGNYRPTYLALNADDPRFYSGSAIVKIEYEKTKPSIGPNIFTREIKIHVELFKKNDIDAVTNQIATPQTLRTCRAYSSQLNSHEMLFSKCEGLGCAPSCPLGYHLVNTVPVMISQTGSSTLGLCEQ